MLVKKNQLQLQKQGSGVVVAEQEGIVLEINVGKGEEIESNQQIMILGELTEGYYTVFNVSKKVDFVSIGDTVALKTQSNMELEGKIQDIKLAEDNLQIEVVFKSREIKENESIKAVLKKQSPTYDLLIPYGALNKDQNKYYVYIVRAVNDTLGESYIIKKCDVYVEDYNESYAAIAEGITAMDCIVETSEKEISEGQKVKVENENEILE